MYDTQLRETLPGIQFFERVTSAKPQPYSAVLAFDHATLSVSPWINAVDLVQELAPLKARLDVVCHSRGGLVVSWALKIAPLNVDQVIFVGSPLAGTSLASPHRLREALDMLANVADALSTLSQGVGSAFPPALPLALGAAGLAKVFGKGLSLGASTPLADATVGLIPGLMSQSRVANNLELERLFPLPTKARLAGIGVIFKPDEVREPIWKFWNRFSNVVDQAKYYGAELIFRQPNDLVVDADSMNQLGMLDRITGGNWKFLGEASHTHHCSYFRNPDAIAFLQSRLQ
jgi:pimeloyl-ACP methyl ester carboxylesterase